MRPPPAFQFYANDWLSSPHITLMSPAEEGAYIRLLCYAWADPDCSLPDDEQQLALLSRMGEHWLSYPPGSNPVRDCFISHPTKKSRLINKRLYAEWKKLRAFRRERTESGRKGATSRWKSRQSKDSSANSSAIAQPMAEGMAKNSSSSSSSSSSLKKEEKIAGFTSSKPAAGAQHNGHKSRRMNLADDEFIAALKSNAAYRGIDLDREICKLKAWLLTPKGRGKQLTRSRLVNWLNKIDTPMQAGKERIPL